MCVLHAVTVLHKHLVSADITHYEVLLDSTIYLAENCLELWIIFVRRGIIIALVHAHDKMRKT